VSKLVREALKNPEIVAFESEECRWELKIVDFRCYSESAVSFG